jgi:hypothetical protein
MRHDITRSPLSAFYNPYILVAGSAERLSPGTAAVAEITVLAGMGVGSGVRDVSPQLPFANRM